jgi:Homoserine dehydrogenase
LKPIAVGLAGLGTVAQGTLHVLENNQDELTRRIGRPLQITHGGARRDRDGVDLTGIRVSRDLMDVARDPDVDVFVELIGGTDYARDLIEAAIESGKHVVTANKALIAEYGNQIFEKAQAKGVTVAFEASVAGGIPVIKALREGLAANQIQWLAGIINGTGNFILTEMRDAGRDFEDVLAEAQALGYAEADPTFDVEGIDAAHKLCILASIAFGIPLNIQCGLYPRASQTSI